MKFLIFFLSIFFLFNLSKKEVQAFPQQSENCSAEHLTFLEDEIGISIWGIENITSTVIYISDHEISPQKKKFSENFCQFFRNAKWFSLSEPSLFRVPESPGNLFLIFHYTLALWQVFLQ